jgi:hypothetical protein
MTVPRPRRPLLAVAALAPSLLLGPGCESFEDIVTYRDFHLRNMLRDDYMGKSWMQPGAVAQPTAHDQRGDGEEAAKARRQAQEDQPQGGLQGLWQSLIGMFSEPVKDSEGD